MSAAAESSEAGTKGKEVLKLKEKLSQCRLEREGLLKEKKKWMRKEKSLRRGLEIVNEKFRTETEANLNARSKFKNTEKPLKEALETKRESVRQLGKDVNKSLAKREMLHIETQTANAQDKYDRLDAELQRKFKQAEVEDHKLKKLRSEMNEKWDKLFAFLETHVKNSKIPDDVRTLAREHISSYIDTLKSDEDDRNFGEMLTKYMQFILQPHSSRKQNKMSAGVDSKSLISAAVSKCFNFFLRKKMESNDALTNNTSSIGKDAKGMLEDEFLASRDRKDGFMGFRVTLLFSGEGRLEMLAGGQVVVEVVRPDTKNEDVIFNSGLLELCE